MEQYSFSTTKHLMFPDGERKPGSTVRPAAAEEAATAARTTAAAREMRSDDFIVALQFDDATHPVLPLQHSRDESVTGLRPAQSDAEPGGDPAPCVRLE